MAYIRIEAFDAAGEAQCVREWWNGDPMEFDGRLLFVGKRVPSLVLAVPSGGRLEIGAAG
jgi:hypothetical protein